MNRSRAQVLLFSLLVAADQITKWWIQQPDFRPFVVIDGFFNIVRAHNTGVAFSFFADLPDAWRAWFLIAVTMVIALAVLFWWSKERHQQGATPWLLALILAGAVGNIWDRIQLGYVVDFIQWYVVVDGKGFYWPAFNIADTCISVAVAGLLLTNLKRD